MNASTSASPGRILPLLLLLGASGCSGGGGGGGGSSMRIVDCSLTCSDSSTNPGAQISCGVTDVFENQEIRITFSNPIDPASVTNNSFQITERGTGVTPAGDLLLDPQDPRVLIYRPQLTFDSSGNPIFGLVRDQKYTFKVPGTVLDPLGPHIRSDVGAGNASRLECLLDATQGVNDAKPGRPRVFVTVDVVTATDPDGNPTDIDFNVLAQGATNVFRATPVRMVFDDVMNPATLANPVSGLSTFIRAFVDTDGDISGRDDWVPIGGEFTLTIDQINLRTTVVFTPSGGLPSAGGDPLARRKIVMDLSPQIADLAGNSLLNPGVTAFTPEVIAFDPIVVEELFADPAREDAAHSGGLWGGGLLAPGIGGGSGRLGELTVLPGVVVELNTDSEDFSGITNLAVFNPANIIDPPANLVITDGVFEFSRLRVDAGGVLRFVGSKPARFFVRGQAVIQGLIDVSGGSGTLQRSNALAGGVGGAAGGGGGTGGGGGSRPDGAAFVGKGGVSNPGVGPSDVLDPATYTMVNGQAGGGIPFPSTIDNQELLGGGGGALAWPQPTAANPMLHMPANLDDVSGIEVEITQLCRIIQPAAPGAGGAHGLSGDPGIALIGGIATGPLTLAPSTMGGSSEDLGINDLVRTLAPQFGFLRGGGGGGGGGGHLQLTSVNGLPLADCSIPISGTPAISFYGAHSSAGGGGGGGGLQLAVGLRIDIDGVLNLSGGDGGSGTFPPASGRPSDLALAGGGGAGGGLLMQSQFIQIRGIPNRIDISGGGGGEGSGDPSFPATPSLGGFGGAGLLRIETTTPLVIENEEFKITPLDEELKERYGDMVGIENVFSTAAWVPTDEAPEGFSGSQSCWIRPTGSFFKLIFEDDSNGPGWDMRLQVAGQANLQSYRGANDLGLGMTMEQAFGADLGTSPIMVRFQAARAVETLVDPCAVPEAGNTPLADESLTQWVRHPSELADFFGDPARTPNIFRFMILWDRSQLEAIRMSMGIDLEAVEDISITIQPD